MITIASPRQQGTFEASSRHHRPKVANNIGDTKPYCDLCLSDEYLVFEEVRLVRKPKNETQAAWDIDDWCENCEVFYGNSTMRRPSRTILGA